MAKRKSKFKDNKVDELQEVRIRFSEYGLALAHVWIKNNLVDADTAKKLLDISLEFIDQNLICTGCKQLLPNDEYYKQIAQYANRKRAQKCKECWPK